MIWTYERFFLAWRSEFTLKNKKFDPKVWTYALDDEKDVCHVVGDSQVVEKSNFVQLDGFEKWNWPRGNDEQAHDDGHTVSAPRHNMYQTLLRS